MRIEVILRCQILKSTPHTHPTSPHPSPQSQSFSQSYGSILPTSLTYIVLSTRGCSPWRPAAVMSTISCNGIQSLGFSRIVKSTPDTESFRALQKSQPQRWVIQFQGQPFLKKKRKLFPEPLPTSPSFSTLPLSPHNRFWNINQIPFRSLRQSRLSNRVDLSLRID
jgi:hypothetical protein